MITAEQYFRGRPHTPEQAEAADDLLSRVNGLLGEYTAKTGKEVPVNPHTGSQISGLTEGGFRLSGCVQGKSESSHKILFPPDKAGVDVTDPKNELDAWLTSFVLERHGLYREHPDHTINWCHLTTRPPKSGCRTFLPG